MLNILLMVFRGRFLSLVLKQPVSVNIHLSVICWAGIGPGNRQNIQKFSLGTAKHFNLDGIWNIFLKPGTSKMTEWHCMIYFLTHGSESESLELLQNPQLPPRPFLTENRSQLKLQWSPQRLFCKGKSRRENMECFPML